MNKINMIQICTIKVEKVVSSEAASHHEGSHSSWLSLLFLFWLQITG